MSTPNEKSVLGQYAMAILREEVEKRYAKLPTGRSRHLPSWHFPRKSEGVHLPDNKRYCIPRRRQFEGKVCIIGAGVSGLQLARLCAMFKIPYEVLEASDRVGGRAYTHHFLGSSNPHSYYDVGAMRFPKLKIMKPVFDLFEEFKAYLNIEDYYLLENTTPNLYFGNSIQSEEISTIMKPFTDAVTPFIEALKIDFPSGLKLLKQFDRYTTREYLSTVNEPPLSFDEIQTLETFGSSTGMFDQAFTEEVLGFYIFNVIEQEGRIRDESSEEPSSNWVRVDGGVSKLTDAMRDHGDNGKPLIIETRKHVNAIEAVLRPNEEVMLVSVDGEAQPRRYAAVFNSTSLGCLSRMDLTGLPLSKAQQTSIRSLAYNPSIKIGIKFTRAWWVDFSVAAGRGGASSTDRSIRTTVYPSWFDGDGVPAVLIVSYAHQRDAAKLASLINSKEDPDNVMLLDLVLRDLVELYQGRTSPSGEHLTFAHLKSLVLSYYPFDWNHYPHTAGAFAHFGPGQFANLYKAILTPAAGGRFHMVGECSSILHGWIAGALDSTVMPFLQFLVAFGQFDLCAELFDQAEKHPNSVAHIPDEMDEELVYWLSALELEGINDSE